jgi:hypothetical protein
MLSEGVAVWSGMTRISDSDHMPIRDFCWAYLQEGQLPHVSTSLPFRGHIRDLENYYASGCFVQFLVNRDGTEKLAALYSTGNFSGIYGASLATLEQEWIADLQNDASDLPFLSSDLIATVDDVALAYDRFFSGFQGTETEMAAYPELDQARLALLEGRLADSGEHLANFQSILAG